MSGINKAIVLGRLGKDPEIRFTGDGKAIANMTVATSEKWRDKQSGQDQEKTEWHRIVIFGKLAEVCEKYLKKGSQAYFEGRIQTRKWQDNQGQDKYTTEIVADKMQMLDGKPQGGNANQAPQSQKPAAGFDDFDDDIPW